MIPEKTNAAPVLVTRIRVPDDPLCHYSGEMLHCYDSQERFVLAIWTGAGNLACGGGLANGSPW